LSKKSIQAFEIPTKQFMLILVEMKNCHF